MKLYDEEGRNNKKPAAEKLYEESGSDNENVEDIVKGENKKNSKEKNYTNMDEEKDAKQADLLNKEKHHDIPRKKRKMRKLLSPRKWHCQTLEKTFS